MAMFNFIIILTIKLDRYTHYQINDVVVPDFTRNAECIDEDDLLQHNQGRTCELMV